MGLLDGILGQLGGGGVGGTGNAMQNMAIDAIAAKFGIPPALAETAVAALTKAHPEPGDTVATAAEQTGIDPSTMGQIADHLGGEGGLGQLSQIVQNNPELLNALTGMLGGGQGSGGGLGGLAGIAGSLLGGKN